MGEGKRRKMWKKEPRRRDVRREYEKLEKKVRREVRKGL